MYCNFLNLDLRNTLFVECEIKGTDFIDNNLTKADFSKSIFDKSIFHNANLTHANFTGAINYCINPKDNILKKQNFLNQKLFLCFKHWILLSKNKIV